MLIRASGHKQWTVGSCQFGWRSQLSIGCWFKSGRSDHLSFFELILQWQDRKAKEAKQSWRVNLLKAIVVALPMVNLVAVPVYIVARLAIKNRATRTTGCLAAFTVYVLMTIGFFEPSGYLLPGTIELCILIALMMLADIGLQVRALDET